MAENSDIHHADSSSIVGAQNLSSTSTSTHPLQDVDLHAEEEENLNELPFQHQQKQQQLQNKKLDRKQNWVKFDDDDDDYNDDVSVSVGGSVSEPNDGGISDDHIRSSISVINGEKNATRATAVTETAEAAAAAANSTNKLSPLPPLMKQQTSSSDTSGNTNTSVQPYILTESMQQSLNEEFSKSTAPVQRSMISSTSMPDVAPAVLNTESTHVNLNASGRMSQHQHLQQQQQKPNQANASAAANNQQYTQLPQHHHSNNGTRTGGGYIHKAGNVTIPIESAPSMRTIELSTGRIREGFANGDVIVTLLPANTKWPWITPAIFRPELVPEELMAQGLTLTVEEYVNAMETLVNDYRFTVYNICYKRILVCWILFAFTVLLTLLFSGLQGVALFSLGVGWLFLNAAAIFICMWVKLRLSRGLEKCLARVNRQLMKHKILLLLDDRGRISCHKVNLCFLYFDATQCVNFLNEFLEQTEQNGGEAIKAGWERKLDIDINDIIIQGTNPVRLSRKQVVAQELFLSYLQRWGKDFLRRRLDWTVQEAGVHETPRHLQSSICPCQYEEEVLRNKIKIQLKRKQCCGINCIGCWL